ncbi:hypothetical protein FGO68_gene762 [Halteria grandinella]|uniref:Thioredoxin domain-containing protein n=1 Tax=Halteria grandinella TaxID=5974 RepID=A0A8J8SYW7_HALGN|nr:hypothetical protein FGO68_gene762 [Halteria grandinella]
MTIRIGDTAPDFDCETTEGPLNFYAYLGSAWGLLFSHPKDFTPVCTTELGQVSRLKEEWAKRGVKVIGLSVDPVEFHRRWAQDIEQTQKVKLNFPVIADHDQYVSNLYGMIHPNSGLGNFTVRDVFVIGPDKKVKLTLTYPASTGRNFSEILRVIDSLQLTDKFKVATPSDWRQGEDVIIEPAVSDQEAKQMYPKGWRAEKEYLRYVRQEDLKEATS